MDRLIVSLKSKISQIRAAGIPDQLQGITKNRIRATLSTMDRETDDRVDAVFALLDNVSPSLFGAARPDARFSDGASTQHIALHIGTFQRGGAKLDREGRDYWIKPLRDIGAMEPTSLALSKE